MPAPKRIILSRDERRLAAQGQRAMLLAEQRTLMAVRGASADAVRHLVRSAAAAPSRDAARRVVLMQMRGAGDQLRHDVAGAVLAARGDARDRAHAQLGTELQAAAKRLQRPIPTPPRTDASEDAARADAAAESYTAAVRSGLVAATIAWSRHDDGTSLARTLDDAHEAQDYRLRRIAATEVAQAYGAEHNDAADSLAKRVAQVAPLLVKVWDATLDRRTCQVCRDMDGKYAVVGADFAAGRLPGNVHAFCRCTSTLLILKSAAAQFAEGFSAGFSAAS